MNTMQCKSLAATLASTAIAAALAFGVATGPAQAQTHAHDAATPAKLSLDHGKKWTTDGALRAGMSRIRTLVEPQLGAAHASQLSPAQYAALAGQVETEVGGIVANCKLEPQADAMLHLLIGEIGAGTDAIAGKTPARTTQDGLIQVAAAVNDYARHFNHPGFKPIRIAH